MTCVALGAMFSLAIFQEPIALDTGWSHIGIASAMTLNFIVMGFGGFFWGAASDRFGPRIVVLIGAALLGLALVLSSRAGSLLQFQLTYGILVGIAASTFFAPMIAATTAWFDENRGLAVSLVSAGMGVAPMTISPFARWLISAYDWRTGDADHRHRRLGALGAGGIAGAACARSDRRGSRAAIRPRASDCRRSATVAGVSLAAVHRARADLLCLLRGAFGADLPHGELRDDLRRGADGGCQHLQRRGLAGLGGRLIYGTLADRIGVKPVLVGGLLIQAVVLMGYLFVSKLGEFYMLALVFGSAYGGVMPLYAVLAREYFGPKIIGTVFGAATMLSSLGMAFGPLIGGWIFDTFRQLFLAVHRLVDGRARGGGDCAGVSGAAGRARAAGVGGCGVMMSLSTQGVGCLPPFWGRAGSAEGMLSAPLRHSSLPSYLCLSQVSSAFKSLNA
jgi:MFS family permease